MLFLVGMSVRLRSVIMPNSAKFVDNLVISTSIDTRMYFLKLNKCLYLIKEYLIKISITFEILFTLKNKSVLDAFKSDLDAFDENEKRLRLFSKK